LRDWLTLYTDSLSPDDVSPVSAPRRAAVNPAYLVSLPKLPKLDLRIEGVNTNTPSSSVGGHFVYNDFFYHDLSTNKNNIIGSWIGREGQGYQGWCTYWFSARSSLQFAYRHAKVASDFIPAGGDIRRSFGAAEFLGAQGSERSSFNAVRELARACSGAYCPNELDIDDGISYQPKALSLPFHGSHKDQDQGLSQIRQIRIRRNERNWLQTKSAISDPELLEPGATAGSFRAAGTGRFGRAASTSPALDLGLPAFTSATCVLGLLASTLLAFLIPKSYTSTAQLMPPDSQTASGMAMMTALASRLQWTEWHGGRSTRIEE